MSMAKYKASTAINRAFDGRRRLRAWRNSHFGGMSAVKAHPLSMVRFRPDEGGTVQTNLHINLAPVSGFMRTNAYVDVYQVLVPYQAIEKAIVATDDKGVTEMAKRRLLEGQGIGLTGETEISKACNIHPRSVGGSKKVSASIHVAYNAAVNHLRKAAYHAADEAPLGGATILPAILSANVLDRFGGVLDPERHIDGAINLTGDLAVKGISKGNQTFPTTAQQGVETDGNSWSTYDDAAQIGNTADTAFYVEEDPNKPGYPNIRVNLDGANELTLRDMIESQALDGLIRQFAQMIENDPINGEEAVERALYSMSVDYDANCQVMFHKRFELTAVHRRPMDGASFNDVSGNWELNTSFATLVPRSELGGQLVTIAMVKPMETLEAQPDPSQTEAWEVVNRIHDETQLDEVLLTRADLESDVAAIDEDQSAFWVGHNHLKHDYTTQGANAQQVFETEMQSAMWLYAVPTSVTPSNINYPAEGVDMYPFHNWTGAHAEYTIDQVAAISTSLAKGPTPIERIQLFHDDPSLVSED